MSLCGRMDYNLQTSGIVARTCCCEQDGLVKCSLGQAGIVKNRSWVTLCWNIEQRW